MSYSVTIGLALGTSKTGLTLEAQPVNSAGAAVGSAIPTGFVEYGGGAYSWTGPLPDGHTGGVKFQLSGGGAFQAFAAINPPEVENPDVKTSTRSTYSGGAVASVTGNVGGNVVGSVGSVTADVGLTQAGADKVWSSAARTLTGFGTLVADIWANATRTLSAFAFNVTVGTNSDKTGYSLAGSEHTAIATDTQTGLTAQGYTSARAALLAHLDADISTRLAASGYTAPPGLTAIINGVLDELLSSHTGAGTVGAGIQAAGAAGDPWATTLPSTYSSGQAGYLIGHNLDTPVSTRAGAGASVTTIGPVLTGGAIALVKGDTYQAERGTALQWTYTGPVDVLTSPAPTVTFTIPTTPTALTVPVTVGGTAGAVTLTAELSAADTGALPSGGVYPYSVLATWADPDTDRVTLVRGAARVHA